MHACRGTNTGWKKPPHMCHLLTHLLETSAQSKNHTNTALQSIAARFVRSHLNTRYTVHYPRSQGKNSRLLGFSSCVCPFQLPPLCFPSCSCCPVVSSPFCFSFLPLGLFLSNFFLLIRHSSHSYLLSPHAWNKSLFSLCCLL